MNDRRACPSAEQHEPGMAAEDGRQHGSARHMRPYHGRQRLHLDGSRRTDLALDDDPRPLQRHRGAGGQQFLRHLQWDLLTGLCQQAG